MMNSGMRLAAASKYTCTLSVDQLLLAGNGCLMLNAAHKSGAPVCIATELSELY